MSEEQKWVVGCEGDYLDKTHAFSCDKDAHDFMEQLIAQIGADSGIYLVNPLGERQEIH